LVKVHSTHHCHVPSYKTSSVDGAAITPAVRTPCAAEISFATGNVKLKSLLEGEK